MLELMRKGQWAWISGGRYLTSACHVRNVTEGLPLKGGPFITRTALLLAGEEVTVSDAKARRELGYVGHITLAQGLAEMAA